MFTAANDSSRRPPAGRMQNGKLGSKAHRLQGLAPIINARRLQISEALDKTHHGSQAPPPPQQRPHRQEQALPASRRR